MIRLPMCKGNIKWEAALFLKDSSDAISWNLRKKTYRSKLFITIYFHKLHISKNQIQSWYKKFIFIQESILFIQESILLPF